jgi:hypothetical protein
MVKPAVLFTRADSIYKTLDCDVWDAARDALKWPGGAPVVAHPPCRLWGELSHLSKAPESERACGIFAVEMVRTWGGCLEHPKRSKLWKACAMPRPGERDEFGGFTVAFPQWWFGHPAEKWTWIYICGIAPGDVPEIPFKLGEATHKVTNGGSHARAGRPGYRPEVTRYWRDATPPQMALWLLEIAKKTHLSARLRGAEINHQTTEVTP